MATMVCFGLIRWHRIWGVAWFWKRRTPQRKRKRGKGSAQATGIPRRKPLVKQLLPDLIPRHERLVKQRLPEPHFLWGREPRNNKTRLPPAG